MDPFGDDSLSTNVLSISFAYFCLFLLIDRTKGHKLFNDHLLHLRAELPVQRWQKKVIYFLPFLASSKLESHGKKVEMCSTLFCYRFCDLPYLESWRLRLSYPSHSFLKYFRNHSMLIFLISTPLLNGTEGTTAWLWLSQCHCVLHYFLRLSKECSFGLVALALGPKTWWKLGFSD